MIGMIRVVASGIHHVTAFVVRGVLDVLVAVPRRGIILNRKRLIGLAIEDLVVVFDEDLDHDVVELQVHDGGHSFFFGAEESRPEAHTQVAHRHQVFVGLAGHTINKVVLVVLVVALFKCIIVGQPNTNFTSPK